MLGYQITSDQVVGAALDAVLTGPNGEVVDSTEASPLVDIAEGTHWYYRQFLVNLPPLAAPGSYSVTWMATDLACNQTSATRPGLLTILPPVPVRVPIIYYHKIAPVAYSTYYVPTDTFRKQLQALKAYGYTSVTLQDVMDYRAGLATPPAKPIVITFDDGYENWYTDAFPVLSEPDINYKATFFVATGRVDGTNEWDKDNNPIINMLTWKEISELHESSLIDFQSHTVTHPNLEWVTWNKPWLLPGELAGSKGDLDTRLGQNTKFICYPYGRNTPEVWTEARRAGYFAGLSTVAGVDETCADKWRLKRICIAREATLDYGTYLFLFGPGGLNDPDVIVPKLAANSVQYLDPATNQPLAYDAMGRGQPIKIHVVVSNYGPGADVIAQLAVSRKDASIASMVYDSHLAKPSADIVTDFPAGQRNRVFEWLWQIPADALPGDYSVRVKFSDKFGLLGFYSTDWLPAFALPDDTETEAAKFSADGTRYTLHSAVVTAVFSDCFYAEKQDRSYGIRVEMKDPGMAVGTVANITGDIATKDSGERYIMAAGIVQSGHAAVRPLSMSTAAVGGGTIGYQKGVWVASEHMGIPGYQTAPNPHLNNLGLLIRTWGKVSNFDGPKRTFTVDDGSGACVRCLLPCDAPPDYNWTYAVVTGISSCENIDGKLFPLLRIRSLEDVVPYAR